MKKKCLMLLMACCLQCIALQLKADTITYDFSSPNFWVTEPDGDIHPGIGTSALLEKIYYKETNHCFIGKNEVYFYDGGGLMLKPKASLKIPYNSDWTINKIILHSHSAGSTSVKVNIRSSHDGVPASNSLVWKNKDADYEYEIYSSYRKSNLYIMTTNTNNARIASITIDYTSTNTPEDGSDSDEKPEPSESNDGSYEKPYTVAEVKTMVISSTTNMKNKWIKGTIYGTIRDNINNVSTSGFTHSENIVIGDAIDYIPIKLTDSNVRDFINLKDHPYLKGKELLIKGDLNTYYAVSGMISPTQYEITYTIPINKYGYATLFLDMPVSVPTGSTAYYCTTNSNQAQLHPVGTIIPDSVGVIIESTPNTTCTLTYTTELNANETTIRNINQLIGFTKDTDITTDDKVHYALNAKDGKVGFYIPQTATDAGFTAKANKAYLQVAAEQEAAMFVIHRGNDETAIVPTTHTFEDILYDLQGRAVSFPTSGIYIKAGKKIVIR